jgi:hypothetical protein
LFAGGHGSSSNDGRVHPGFDKVSVHRVSGTAMALYPSREGLRFVFSPAIGSSRFRAV